MRVFEEAAPGVFRVDDDGRVRRMSRSVLASTEEGFAALCKFQSTKTVWGWRAEPRDLVTGPQVNDRVRVLVRPDEWAHGTIDAVGVLNEHPYFQLTYDDGMVVADRLSLPWDFLDPEKALLPGMCIRVPLLADAAAASAPSTSDDAYRLNGEGASLRDALEEEKTDVCAPSATEADGRSATTTTDVCAAPSATEADGRSAVNSVEILRPFACVVDAGALTVDVLSSTGTSTTLPVDSLLDEDVRLASALRLQLSYV